MINSRLTIGKAVNLLEINRTTAKVHLRQLVREGYLASKAAWYETGR